MPSQILHTGGARLKNQIFNGATARPGTLYLGLRTLNGGANPTDAAAADTLTSNLAEASGAGYARIPVTNSAANFPESVSGASSLLQMAQQTFTFTGTLTGLTHAFLATTNDNSGVLIESAPLAVTRNVANGDTLKITFQDLQEQGA